MTSPQQMQAAIQAKVAKIQAEKEVERKIRAKFNIRYEKAIAAGAKLVHYTVDSQDICYAEHKESKKPIKSILKALCREQEERVAFDVEYLRIFAARDWEANSEYSFQNTCYARFKARKGENSVEAIINEFHGVTDEIMAGFKEKAGE